MSEVVVVMKYGVEGGTDCWRRETGKAGVFRKLREDAGGYEEGRKGFTKLYWLGVKN